jgi:hypothetical protein
VVRIRRGDRRYDWEIIGLNALDVGLEQSARPTNALRLGIHRERDRFVGQAADDIRQQLRG